MSKLTESMRDMLNLLEGDCGCDDPCECEESRTVTEDEELDETSDSEEMKRATEREEWVGDAYDRYGHQVGGDERAFMTYRKKFPRTRQTEKEYEHEFYKKWNDASHTAQWRRDIDAALGESDINQDHRVSHGPIWENPKKQTWNNPDAKIWDDLSRWYSFKLDQSDVDEMQMRYYTAGGVLHIEDDGSVLPYAPISKKALSGSLSNLGMSVKELVAWLEGQGVKQKKKPKYKSSAPLYDDLDLNSGAWSGSEENLDESHTAQWRRDIAALYNILGESDIKPGTKKVGLCWPWLTDMRLTELNRKPLTALQNALSSKPDMMSVQDFMDKYGFTQIGETGSFGMVFEHPNLDYVLKVFRRDDLGYISFLNFALRNPSPYLPKFRGKLVHINYDFSAVRMEKLEEYYERPSSGIPWKGLDIYLAAEMEMMDYNAGGRDNVINRIEAALPGLTAVLDGIAGVGLSIDAYGDLGPHNMMWRGNQLVITDPLWVDQAQAF